MRELLGHSKTTFLLRENFTKRANKTMFFKGFEILSPPCERERTRGEGALEAKLEQYLKEVAERFRQEGIPVDNSCRLIPESYSTIFSPEEIQKDQEFLKEKKEKYERGRGSERKKGSQWELLVTALLNRHSKLFGVGVVRTAEYDDFFHHVDHLFIDQETGETVCGFDEVSTEEGPTFERKKEKVLKRNLGSLPGEGGVKIKYGLKYESGKPVLTPLRRVPIFYIACSPEKIEKFLLEFDPNSKESSETERELLNHIFGSIKTQCSDLLTFENLHSDVKEKIQRFQELLGRIDKKESLEQ